MNTLIITAAIAAYMAVGFVLAVLAFRDAAKNGRTYMREDFALCVVSSMVAWPLWVVVATFGLLMEIAHNKFVEKR